MTTAWDLLPSFRRAREFRLYDGARRYLDLWQEDGHALLGHRPGRVRLQIKQQLDRGLIAAYPSLEANRLVRALSDLLPERAAFRWFVNVARFRGFISELIGGVTPSEIVDPAVIDDESESIMVWRPWLGQASRRARIVLPVIPMPGAGWLRIVGVTDELSEEFYPSDPVSPCWLSAVRSSVYALKSHLETFDSAVWTYFDCALWFRRGPYLRLRCEPARFRSLYREFLSHGMILSPEWSKPSIAPSVFDSGEVNPIHDIAAKQETAWKTPPS